MKKQKLIFIVALLLFSFIFFYPQDVMVHADNENGSVADFFNNPNNDEVDEVPPSDQSPGEHSGTVTNSDSNTVGIGFGDVIKTIFSLIFVLAILFTLLKFLQKKNYSFKDSQMLQVLGGANVGQNRSIQIVKVGNSLFVVGVGDNVQLLKEIVDEEEQNQIANYYKNKSESFVQSRDLISRAILAWKNKKNDSQGVSFREQFQQQIDIAVNERREAFDIELQKGNKNE